MREISFKVAGEPRGKGRARSRIIRTKDGREFSHAYTPAETRNYESDVRYQAIQAIGETALFREPVEMHLVAVCSVPASWSRKKRAAALSGALFPAKKPDLDNIVKAVTDALNGVLYADDALIVRTFASKIYGDRPGLSVTVRDRLEIAA